MPIDSDRYSPYLSRLLICASVRYPISSMMYEVSSPAANAAVLKEIHIINASKKARNFFFITQPSLQHPHKIADSEYDSGCCAPYT